MQPTNENTLLEGRQSLSKPEVNVHKLRFPHGQCHDQSQCRLFSLPPELRDMIFHLALMDYEDPTRPYPLHTPYGRPGNQAPRRTDTALLRTCQRVYQETWFRPWASAEQTLWFTSPERCPESVTSIKKLHQNIRRIKAAGVETEIDHVKIYAQLYKLEPGVELTRLFSLSGFQPRRLTICLRHTDWWYWENDVALYIESTFVNKCRFPDSVREVRMELETLERRKGQLISIVNQMKDLWHFTRKDGTKLSASDTRVRETTWEGSATWEDNRWIRDEIGPNRLRYFVATVSWIPRTKDTAATDQLKLCPTIYAQNPPRRINISANSIDSHLLKAASIEETDDSETALQKLNAYYAAQLARVDRRRTLTRIFGETLSNDTESSPAPTQSEAQEAPPPRRTRRRLVGVPFGLRSNFQPTS